MEHEYTYKAKVQRVVDGDTLDLLVDLGFKVFVEIRVRLHGVDTPEVYGVKKGSEEYSHGKAASKFTEQWVEDNDGEVLIRSHDGKPLGQGKYGRWLVEVFPVGEDDCGCTTADSLNEELLEAGHAEAVTY